MKDTEDIESYKSAIRTLIIIIFVLVVVCACYAFVDSKLKKENYSLKTEYEEYKEEYIYTEADSERDYEAGYSDAEYEFYDTRYEDGYDEALKDISDSLGRYKTYGYLLGYYDGYNAYSYRSISSVKGLIDTGLYTQAEYDRGFYDGYDSRALNMSRDVNMPMVHVTSSFINSVGYISEIPVLVICMNEDDWYGYTGVSPSVFMDLIKAASPGTYFNENIKNHYDYKKIR